jgi:hypothetical protein
LAGLGVAQKAMAKAGSSVASSGIFHLLTRRKVPGGAARCSGWHP